MSTNKINFLTNVPVYSNTGVYGYFDSVYVNSGANSGRYFVSQIETSYFDINQQDYAALTTFNGWYNISSPYATLNDLFQISYNQESDVDLSNRIVQLGEGYNKSINKLNFVNEGIKCKISPATLNETKAFLVFSELRNVNSGFFFRNELQEANVDYYNISNLSVSQEYLDNFNLDFNVKRVFENNTSYISNQGPQELPLTGKFDLYDFSETVSGFDQTNNGVQYTVDNRDYAILVDAIVRYVGGIYGYSASDQGFGRVEPNMYFAASSPDLSSSYYRIGTPPVINGSDGAGALYMMSANSSQNYDYRGTLFDISGPGASSPAPGGQDNLTFFGGDYAAAQFENVSYDISNGFLIDGTPSYSVNANSSLSLIDKKFNLTDITAARMYKSRLFNETSSFLVGPIPGQKGATNSNVKFMNLQTYFNAGVRLNKSDFLYINNLDFYYESRALTARTADGSTIYSQRGFPASISFYVKIFRKNTPSSNILDSTLVKTVHTRYNYDWSNVKRNFNLVFRISDVSDFSSVSSIYVE